jgi:putative membrane protein
MARTRTSLTVAVAALALAACDSSRRAADTVAARTDSAASGAMANADTAMHRTDSAAGMVATNTTWTPATVLGYASAANMGEVEEGQLAEKKATNPAVKAYARQMVTDHQAMLKDVKALASKLNVTADTAMGDTRDLIGDAQNEMKDLADKAAGADWDKDFIDKEIDGHQKVLDKLQDLAKNTTDADVRAALVKATGKVQEHLTKAQNIKNQQLKS